MFLIDVVEVKPLPNRGLEVVFADGLRGSVQFDRIVREYTGVFRPLLDDAYFSKVAVNPELGTVVWPNGADICADVLYSYISGKPIIVQGERVLN